MAQESYLEEGQFVNDELQGFGRRIWLATGNHANRIGYGKDNEQRADCADNFKLHGLGKRNDELGLYEDDSIKTTYDNLDATEKEKCTFDRFLIPEDKKAEMLAKIK